MKTRYSRLPAIFLLLFLFGFLIPKTNVEAANGDYWIKVNKLCNVATVYQSQNGQWVPVRAMLTSCGGSKTPTGTFRTKEKYRWHMMFGSGAIYAQYCIRIQGHYLFHTVTYYNNGNRATQSVSAFNKLGTDASMGCVRLATFDAKWIYNHCKSGTRVTIYSSSNPGPLGKPDAYKMPVSAGKKNWDPTDASSSNKYYITLPILKQRLTTVPLNNPKYANAKALVVAKQKNGGAVKNLKIVSVEKFNNATRTYSKAPYDSSIAATYKITYTLTGSEGVSITKTFKYKTRIVK